jgi:hypothetical protein
MFFRVATKYVSHERAAAKFKAFRVDELEGRWLQDRVHSGTSRATSTPVGI